MANQNRSWTDEMLIKAVSSCRVMIDVVKVLGLLPRGSNYITVRKHINRLGLDISHFMKPGDLIYTKERPSPIAYTKEDASTLFKEGTTLQRSAKRCLAWFKDASKCSECGQGRTWNKKPLLLQIDHINGDCFDNRLDNLRYLCPNCHTQTHTYAGKNSKREPLPNPTLPILKGHPGAEKILWPDDEALAELVRTTPMSTLASSLGVSDVAIGKRCRKRGIQTPPKRFWAKTL